MATGRVPTTANSPLTAKGDLFTYSTAPARLAVGNSGEQLVADSSTSTGLRYQAPKTNNVIINGNLDIWQRGTSFTSVIPAGQYLADRWTATHGGTNVSMTVTQDTAVPNPNSEYSIKYQQITTGATSLTEFSSRQFIEQNNILPLLGKACVVSFWYRSNKTGSHGIRIFGAYNTGGTDQATTFTVNAADTWEYKTLTVTAFSGVSAPSASPTASGALLDIGFRVQGAGFTTLSANDYFQFTQVQLEVGSVATPFARAGGTIQGELAAAQRYYQKSYPQGTAPATANVVDGIQVGKVGDNTVVLAERYGSVVFPVVMRIAPTVTIRPYTTPANTGRVSTSGGTDLAAGSGNAQFIGDKGFNVQNNSGGTVTTTDKGVIYHYEASAEL